MAIGEIRQNKNVKKFVIDMEIVLVTITENTKIVGLNMDSQVVHDLVIGHFIKNNNNLSAVF